MDRRELVFRTQTTIRKLAGRVATSFRQPRWSTDVHAVLAPEWHGTALARHFRTRERRFPLCPSDRLTVRQFILADHPEAAAEASRQADAILKGRLSILGYRDLDAGNPIDWHRDPVHGRVAPRVFWSSVSYLDPSIGDHKVTWEINRHQHWLVLGRAAWLTGRPGYAAEIVRQLRSWMAENPPLVGINWASMLELAFRSLSWLWAMPFVLALDDEADAWLADMLVGLDAQLEHVRRNLSWYFSPNTHLLGEALALYVAGRSLPEMRRAPRWQSVGRHVLLDQIARQIHPDGGHVELSTHYHRYALDFYLLALSIARLTADAEAVPAFEEACRRLARYGREITRDDGTIPIIGDDDGGQLFPICQRPPADIRATLAWAAVLLDDPSLALPGHHTPEEVTWLLGRRPLIGEGGSVERNPMPAEAGAVTTRVFPETGYAVARAAGGSHLVFDAGRHGFLNGGHAHADVLSVVVSLAGRPVVIDPGTSTYTMDPGLRDRMRAARTHNTVIVDGREPAVPAGPFHWHRVVNGAFLAAHGLERWAWFAGEHDGYAPVRHRRGVFMTGDGLVVCVDSLLATPAFGGSNAPEAHAIEARWHLDPRWTCLTAASGGRGARSAAQARLIWEEPGNRPSATQRPVEIRVITNAALDAVRAGEDDGWCAPVYGQLLPAWTLILSHRDRVPCEIVTAFCEGSLPPALSVSADGEGEGRRIVVEVSRGQTVDTVTVAGHREVSYARRVARAVHAGAR